MENGLIIEEDNLRHITELETELKIATEALMADFVTLDHLSSLHQDVTANGVSRIAMESLSAICPEVISEYFPPNTFTIESSTHQLDVAQESFLSAIGNAISWLFEKLIEALKKVIELFFMIFKWLFGIGEEAKRQMNIHEKIYDIINQADTINKEFDKTESEFKQKVRENRQEGVAVKSPLFEEYLKKTYNTQLDVDILNNAQYASLEGALQTANAILVLCESYSVMLFEIQKALRIIAAKETIGPLLYDWINEIKDKLLAQSGDFTYIFIPYSYEQAFNAIAGFGGVRPRDYQTWIHHDHQKPIWYLDQDRVVNDSFWKGRIADLNGHPIPKIQWNMEHRIYSASLLVTGATHLDFSRIEKQNFKRALVQFDKIRERITEIGKKVDTKGKDMISFGREIKRMIPQRDGYLRNEKMREKNLTLAWPEMYNGLYLGDPVTSKQLQGPDRCYVATDFPKQLTSQNATIFSTIANGYLFLQGPFKDISAVIERNFKMHRDYAQYLNEKRKDTERMQEYYK